MARLVVTIVTDSDGYRALGLMIGALEMILGKKIADDVTVTKEGAPKKKGAKQGPKVEYHIMMRDAVDTKLIEENTVKGKLFLYLLHNGPDTAQGIHKAFAAENWSMKGVESAVMHLRSMGIIESKEVSPLPDLGEDATDVE